MDRHNEVGVSGEEIRPCSAKALRMCSISIASCSLYVEKMNFVIEGEGKAPIAIEAKWNADAFEPDGLQAFIKLNPNGVNLVVSANDDNAYTRTVSGLEVSFCSLAYLRQRV